MGPIAVVLGHTTATAPHDNKDLALLEVGEQRQVGFSALLVSAEKVTEFDEFDPQGDGPEVVRDDRGRSYWTARPGNRSVRPSWPP
ncbi:hypothetical protein [Streptomyces sp. NPDC057545]|uniref:hypothetical protein n=1 Tax=Streptomyces sp. NPDC057545 TaxID=3346164 RepID=UPI00369A21CA